jgi:micrococcal nuclease
MLVFKSINCLIIGIVDCFSKYGRSLGYLILNDGRVLNEIMIKEGYAKPYNDVFCEKFPMYQEWNLQAKSNLRGLYSIINKF